MNFSDDVLCEVKKNCKKNQNQESCGIIIGNKVVECENLSDYPQFHFVIDPLILIENNPDCIYHSHVNISCKPSKLDLLAFREICIPFLIYSIIDDEFYLLK